MSLTRPSRSPSAPRRLGALAVYYGYGQLKQLSAYGQVALQPGAYSPAELAWLRARGVRVSLYLSLGEEAAETPADYHLPGLTPGWGTRRVDPAHPAWVARVVGDAASLAQHADGLLLDTLDSHPDPAPMLELLRAVRAAVPGARLIANRGATLLPELAGLVDGVLIEALSTTWEGGYAPHDAGGLAYTAALLERLCTCGLPVWGLDYAVTPELAAFAHARAADLQLSTFVSTRNLDTLPGPGGVPTSLAS